MGVKFRREYDDILNDLVACIAQIENNYAFFDMTEEDWREMSPEEQQECLRTLADDVFYGLGSEPRIEVGEGLITYDAQHHIVKVFLKADVVHMIHLM